MVYEFLAPGFEEVEALIPVDVLRRGGIDIKTVSITDSLIVTSAHGIGIQADMLLEEADLDGAELLMLPGGLPGADNLRARKPLCDALVRQAERGGKIAAICAAPYVLGQLGILKGKRATCYPGFEAQLEGAEYTAELFTVDGNITTGEGPAATFPYAYALLEQFVGAEITEQIKEGMRFNHLMA